jgi:hypothetical protein
MVKEKKPSYVFLMETLSTKKYLENIKIRIGFDGLFVAEPVGRSGGLALLWKKECDIEIYNYSRHHINAIVRDDESSPLWKLTGFYGHPKSARRGESWALLKHLKSFQPVPWLCARDFNEILEQSEKEGAAIQRESQMESFREALEECGLCDLGYTGPRFTWCSKRTDRHFTKEWLDRVVANQKWCS